MIPFGKYANQPLDIIPRSYLDWFMRKCTNADKELLEAVAAELKRRDEPRPAGEDKPKPPEVVFRAANREFADALAEMSGRAPRELVAKLRVAWEMAVSVFNQLRAQAGELPREARQEARQSVFETLRRLYNEGPPADRPRG